MTHATAAQRGLWDKTASHSPWEGRLERILERGLSTHPVVTMALSLAAVGAGMLLTVSAGTLLIAVPMGMLLGWF